MNTKLFIETKLRKLLTEAKDTECPVIKLSQEVVDEVSKYNSSEELLRRGGISTEALDRLAFGFSSDDIKQLDPKELNVKWKEDYANVLWEIQKSGLKPKNWAKNVSLSEPIEVSYKKGKYWIEDGHHRYAAAKALGVPLKVVLEIEDNPILKLTPNLGYDEFHRCIFRQISGKKE